MADWAVTNRKSGEVQFVKSLGGYDPSDWRIKKLSREPEAYHDFDGERLVVNEARRARIEEAGRVGRMSEIERHQDAVAKAMDRLRAERSGE